MNTKTISAQALKVIDGYARFSIGDSAVSVPYFNNKTVRARMGLRARIGKGSPKDLHEELQTIFVKQHIDASKLSADNLKKILTDQNLGIDCSAFAYYILDAENKERGHGHLNRRLKFMTARSPVGKMMSYLRPVENCNVKTLASDTNSRAIPLKDARPGDMITMIMAEGPENTERNHILVIHKIESDNDDPKALHYSHAIAYPEDGLYGSGIRQGKIEIAYPTGGLMDRIWTEEGSADRATNIFKRAQSSKTELRRLKWLS